MMFEGYTGGGGKEIVGGLMSTGDVGPLRPRRAACSSTGATTR